MAKKSAAVEGVEMVALLRRPLSRMGNRIFERLEEEGFAGIRPSHGVVLRNLKRSGASTSELAAKARITKQSMSYLVEGLTSSGYVVAIPNPVDRRSQLIILTDRGLEAQNTIERLSREVEEEIADEFGEEKWRKLRNHLERLYAMLGDE